jgi:hypothetical protein
MGYDFTHLNALEEESSFGVSLGCGLSDRVDVHVTVPYAIEPVMGFETAEVMAKFRLIEGDGEMPDFSMTFAVNPGSDGYVVNSIASQSFGSLALHVNLGYEATGTPGNRGCFTYGGALEFELSDRMVWVGEAVGVSMEGLGTLEGLLGLTVRAFDPLVLDLGIALGLNNSTPDWRITSGLTLGF